MYPPLSELLALDKFILFSYNYANDKESIHSPYSQLLHLHFRQDKMECIMVFIHFLYSKTFWFLLISLNK